MDSKKRPGRADDMVLNVAPGDQPADIPAPPTDEFANARGWNRSKAGMSKAWSNYRTHLGNSFKRMDRGQQEALIGRMCLIVTVGVTGLALLLFYNFTPRAVRLILVPAAICSAWYAANKLVTPVVLARLDEYLSDE